jgi:hypothetical protein
MTSLSLDNLIYLKNQHDKHDWQLSTCLRCGITFTIEIQKEIYTYCESNQNITYDEAAKYMFECKYKCLSDDECLIKKALE